MIVLVYCILSLFNCMIFFYCSPTLLHDILLTSMARYSVFVLKVPLNTKQTNKSVTDTAPPGIEPGFAGCKSVALTTEPRLQHGDWCSKCKFMLRSSLVWLGGRAVRMLDQRVVSSNPGCPTVECNPGQVVARQHNLVPANGRWCLAAGKVTAYGAVSCAAWSTLPLPSVAPAIPTGSCLGDYRRPDLTCSNLWKKPS